MDFGSEASFPAGNVAPNFPETGSGLDIWGSGMNSPAIWATEDDYRAWNGGFNLEIPTNSANDSRPESQSRSGSEPPSKKTRNSQGADSLAAVNSRSKAIGKMFFKTKLCCKFRAGVCPYITNCNFAHGIEELRRPPPNWQEIVAAHEEERGGGVVEPPREEHQIPTFSSSEMRGESQRSYKGRHCKKFFTEEGCPYGENCTFLHDDYSRTRESVAISLSPSMGGGYANNTNGQNQKPSNWKTRICNKWETTGSCPFGSKCHFAHGLQELHKYGGGLVDMDGKDSSPMASDSKQSGTPLKAAETVVASNSHGPHSDVYHLGLGVTSQRPSLLSQRVVQRAIQKWKGPDKISKIYGDWIDDIE